MRINDRIRIPQVRVIGPDGEQVGILSTTDAMEMAQENDLDLVEVAPQADPPVCRIMDYGKYKYEQAVKQREARKKQSHVVVKEMKMRPKIDRHDYGTKKGHVVRFLNDGAKVKITIMFRGREMVHPEIGKRLLDQLAEELQEIAKVENVPKLDGRNMTMVLGPIKEPGKQQSKPAAPPKKREARPAQPGAPAEAVAETESPGETEETEETEAESATSRPIKVTRAEGG